MTKKVQISTGDGEWHDLEPWDMEDITPPLSQRLKFWVEVGPRTMVKYETEEGEFELILKEELLNWLKKEEE